MLDVFDTVPWFEQGRARFEAGLVEANLTPDEADVAKSLFENGFAQLNVSLPASDIDGAAAFVAEGLGRYGRVQDAWCANRHVRSIATFRPLLDLLSKLYRRRAFPFQTLNFPAGTEQGTHSDTYFFNSAPARFMCGVWVALEDIRPDAGPLHYYPGSHKLPVFSKEDLAGDMSMADYSAHIRAALDKAGVERKTACLKKGDVFLWSANLFHGGDRVTMPGRTRLSQVTHYFFEDCAYFTPVRFDLAKAMHVLRDPYDIARKRTVKSRRDLVAGRPSFRSQLHQRAKVMLRKPSYFSKP